ncbi:MAG: hypothetical protein WD851_18085 [Pirellulales bacterium]
MSDRDGLPPDPQLEAYLDGLLTGAERLAFEESLRNDPVRREQVELQTRIDASIARRHPTTGPAPEHLAELSAQFDAAGMAGRRRMPAWILGVAAAAAIGAVLLAWRPFGTGHSAPFFQPQPVAQLYAEAVESGFAPYYECDEADRFAAVFARRQGQPLRLLPLPESVEMLGISYPGGLSRDSTAMLCRVEGQPVMVLVDRAQADQSLAQQNNDPSLHVFREQRDGLVFYEITPFDAARVIDHLVIAENSARRG